MNVSQQWATISQDKPSIGLNELLCPGNRKNMLLKWLQIKVQMCLHNPAAEVVRHFSAVQVPGVCGHLKGFTVFGVRVQDQIENLFSIQ